MKDKPKKSASKSGSEDKRSSRRQQIRRDIRLDLEEYHFFDFKEEEFWKELAPYLRAVIPKAMWGSYPFGMCGSRDGLLQALNEFCIQLFNSSRVVQHDFCSMFDVFTFVDIFVYDDLKCFQNVCLKPTWRRKGPMSGKMTWYDNKTGFCWLAVVFGAPTIGCFLAMEEQCTEKFVADFVSGVRLLHGFSPALPKALESFVKFAKFAGERNCRLWERECLCMCFDDMYCSPYYTYLTPR